MKGPNLSSWALDHAAFMRFIIAAAAIMGIFAYATLGRQEDPDFTIKNMLVVAAWPGASAEEIADQVALPLERAVQSVPELDYVRANVEPGRVVLNVKLRDVIRSEEVPAIWTKIRHRVTDRASELPLGVRGPSFHDDFGETYGNIFAITGDGYSLPRLRSFADALRTRLIALPDVGRVEFEAEPTERIYVEYHTAKLAALGIDPRIIAQTIHDTNIVLPAGVLNVGPERVRIAVTGSFGSVDEIRNIGIVAGGRSFRLSDIATVTRGLTDPAEFRMRFDGKEAVGVKISLRKGGNITRLGKDIEALVSDYERSLPLGVEIHTVSNQPEVVKEAIGEFTTALAEAVAIVLAVTFFSLGMRPGFVVALCIPIVLALTFAVMQGSEIPLHRVSLGALIIALGLLVDDAIIVVEQIETHLHAGWDKVRAATSAYLVTAQPMLIGTLITAVGFLPIALAPSSAGEYASSIFQVVAISLGFSWLVAVFVTPLIATWLLPEKAQTSSDHEEAHDHLAGYDSPFYIRFRNLVQKALVFRRTVITGTALIFVGSIALFIWAVPQQFFPNSDRPELLIDLRVSQNGSFDATSKVAARMEQALRGDKDIASITSYVGGGAPRFYLSLDVQTPSLSLAQLVVKANDTEARDRVAARVQTLLNTRFPEVRGRVSTLELGPPVGQPLKIRLSGRSYADIAAAAEQLDTVLRADPRIHGVNKDYGEALKTVRVEIDQDKARALGVSTANVNNSLQVALEGTTITTYREGDRAINVVVRLAADERNSLDRLSQALVPTASGRMIPVSQVARLVPAFEPAELNRRSSLPTITVQADVTGVQPANIAAELEPQLEQIRLKLPDGATLTVAGSIEESAASQGSVISQVPVALVLILILLMMQVQSTKKMLLILATGPLAIIGVAIILAIFQIPFGFVAMLGGLALFGMVVRNSVILVSQIEALEDAGIALAVAIREAAVHRLRPILLTALAAVLAMVPLTRSIFWGPMAFVIMGGLIFATMLTLIFLPALYAAAYGARDEDMDVANG